MTRSCAVPFEKRLVAALLLAFSPPALAQPTASTPVGSQALATTFEEVAAGMDEKLRGFQQEQHVPGLVWGVVRDGRLAHFGGVGRRDLNSDQAVDADSLFRIASMSKAFTALAILELRDQGRLRLDAAAEEYVPEMRRWRYPTTDSPRIRVRDLLAHVSGFVTDNEWGDRQQSLSEAAFSRMLRDGPPFNHAPQAQFEYSNYGYALLGRIIITVSGRPFNEYIEQEIMRPLGMASTGYDVFAAPRERRVLGYRWENDAWAREPDMAHGAFGAMGGVQTSANDYARWLAFRGQGRGIPPDTRSHDGRGRTRHLGEVQVVAIRPQRTCLSMPGRPRPVRRAAIPRTVWVLGLVSFFMDISSEMIHALLPLFLTATLGASITMVGLIDGVAESTAAIAKVFSGYVSDRMGRRKPLILLGYGLGAISKPFFAVANAPLLVFAARFADRIGKGLRGAPRDALVADVTPLEIRGRAYGLRQALDTAGAFAGPLIAIALMALFADICGSYSGWR